ncbi:hypothetical protein ACS0TY_024991 [Phlomoides rotata]
MIFSSEHDRRSISLRSPSGVDVVRFLSILRRRSVLMPHDFVVRSPAPIDFVVRSGTQIRSDDDRFPSTTDLKIVTCLPNEKWSATAQNPLDSEARRDGRVAHSLVTRALNVYAWTANIRVGVTKNSYAGEGHLGTITNDSGGFYMPLQGDEGGTNEVSFYTSFSSNTKVPGHITRFFPKFDGTQLMEASDGSCINHISFYNTLLFNEPIHQ